MGVISHESICNYYINKPTQTQTQMPCTYYMGHKIQIVPGHLSLLSSFVRSFVMGWNMVVGVLRRDLRTGFVTVPFHVQWVWSKHGFVHLSSGQSSRSLFIIHRGIIFVFKKKQKELFSHTWLHFGVFITLTSSLYLFRMWRAYTVDRTIVPKSVWNFACLQLVLPLWG